MGKHMKLGAPGTRPVEESTAALPERDMSAGINVDSALRKVQRVCDALLDLIQVGIDSGEASPQLVREGNGTVKAQVVVIQQIERRERQVNQDARKLRPELVMSYLRSLTPERRAHVMRELQSLDVEGSVLA